MSESVQKRLRLMTYWLFVVLVGFWTTVLGSVYVSLVPWIPPNEDRWGYIFAAAWPLMALILVLVVAVYAGYRFWYLQRNPA